MKDQKTHRGEAYVDLLKDPDLERWFHNVARGSNITADVYLRRLGRFCKENKTTPAKLIKMKDKDRYNLIIDHVTKLENQHLAGSYIHSILKSVKSWLLFHDPIMAARIKIKIKDAKDTPTLRDERTPSNDELRKIFLSSNKNGRVISALMAFSGLRPQVLGNYLGNDGLRLSDFPEMKIQNDKVSFEKIPTIIRVRRELSKSSNAYVTFLGEEGCEYVINYLEERMKNGEKLSKDSALVTSLKFDNIFISTSNIRDAVRIGIREAGFKWRPYVLRAYFDTQLMLAENKGLVIRDFRSFWMGHTGDIENRYTTNKGKLMDQVLDEMRNAYSRSIKFLETKKVIGQTPEETEQDFNKKYLKVIGLSDEVIEKYSKEGLTDEKLSKITAERFRVMTNQNGNPQKVVTAEEAEKLINEGWSFVNNLQNGKVVVKSPNPSE